MISQAKEGSEFATSNKSRERAGKQMAPIIEKIESEFALVLSEARIIKDKANEVLKFESEKLTLERHIKELRRQLHETNGHIATLKAENELAQSKQASSMSTLKEEVHSLERTLSRREDYFQSYDKKLSNIMEGLSKHQAYINDRMFLFQQKFKQLTKDTLEMTKEVKRDFDNTMTTNLALKHELTHKIKHTEEKEKILDLYMTEREEIPKKLHQIYQDLRSCLRHSEFEEFKCWHDKTVEESLSKAKSMMEKMLPPQAQETLRDLEERMGEMDSMRARVRGLEGVKQQVEEINQKLNQLESKEDHKLAQFREETEEIEEKIIEVIDKKIETIEEEIENLNIQNEESVDQKLDKMKEYLVSLIQEAHHHRSEKSSIQEGLSVAINQEEHATYFSAELVAAKKEREIMTQHSQQIKNLAEGLQSKLTLFSNRITMCRSDIEIFSENTTRELKKIIDLRKEEEGHMEQVGRVLADIFEALLMLTSLSISQEAAAGEGKSYVTFHDGIILELEKSKDDTLNYRRHQATPLQFKQSLLYALINRVDSLAGLTIFKWEQHRPSAFFNKIKDNLMVKCKKEMIRSPSAQAVSPRRKVKKSNEEEDLFFDLKMESEQLLKNSCQKPKIVNNSTLLLTSEKPKSEMQIRYKLKKMEERSKKQDNERNCFTASRSHRRTKISFN